MRIIYNIFFLVFSVFYVPYLIFKNKFHKDFFQKLGNLPEEVIESKKPIWIHAVSVGESVLAVKLIKEIKRRSLDLEIVVSTTTQTGYDLLNKNVTNLVNGIFYYPLDFSFIVSKVIKLVDPMMYVLIETELWPNLLEEFKRKKIPVILVNGRISDNSFKNYKRIKFITKKLLSCINVFCVQTNKDAERIGFLGGEVKNVKILGNIKFDETLPNALENDIRKECGFSPNDKIIVAGSTHCPEENSIIGIYKELRTKINNLKLVIVPRHIDRAGTIKVYMENTGLVCLIFTDILMGKTLHGHDILLVDTIGHLKKIYGIADVVVIGGSIAKKGGQNPIEAAIWGKAIVFGPNMFNFREVAEIFLENEAAIRVNDIFELEKTIEEIIKDEDRRRRLGSNAINVIKNNSGVTKKTVDQLFEQIKR